MNWTTTSLQTAIATLRTARDPSTPPPTRPQGPHLTPAQSSAASRARNAIQHYGGALIADPPGTGKSFIGLHLALEAARRHPPILITAPATLATTWQQLVDSAGIRAAFLSHTRLSRDDDRVANTPAPGFIIIDEAHAFRSPNTRRYHTLARLGRHARMLLLSATPINNSLMDLYFQLSLFLPDSAFAHLGLPSLLSAFKSASSTPDQPLPHTLASALRLIVIRRPRSTSTPPSDPPATSNTPTTLRMPSLLPPSLLHYDLDSASPDFTNQTLHSLQSLTLAAFTPTTPTTRPPAELLRLTLAKRLESSIAAFAASLRSLLAFHSAFLQALDEDRILRPPDARASSDLAVQLLLTAVVGEPVPAFLDRDRLDHDVRHDLHLITATLDRTRQLIRHDPKRTALLHHLHTRLANRHILIFTEFRETAADLWNALRYLPGTARLDGSGAWIASGPTTRTDVIRRFAPSANHAGIHPRERIRTLITTDILSEGVNLQDADTVIAYDLPWNPVRLIQRIGRIDRIGSPHESVQAFIFMPDRWLDGFITLLDRVGTKLAAIRHGLDSPATTTADPTDTAAADRFATFASRLARGLDPDTAADPADPLDGPQPLALLLDHPRITALADPAASASSNTAVPFATARDPLARRPALVLAIACPDDIPRFIRCTARHATDHPDTPAALRRALDTPTHPELDLDPDHQAAGLTPAMLRRLDHAASTALAHTTNPATTTAPPNASRTTGRAIRRILRLATSQHPHSRSTRELALLADALVQRIADQPLRAGDLICLRQWLQLPLRPDHPDSALGLLRDLQTRLSTPPTAPARPQPHTASRILAAFLFLPAHPTTPTPEKPGRRSSATTRLQPVPPDPPAGSTPRPVPAPLPPGPPPA